MTSQVSLNHFSPLQVVKPTPTMSPDLCLTKPKSAGVYNPKSRVAFKPMLAYGVVATLVFICSCAVLALLLPLV